MINAKWKLQQRMYFSIDANWEKQKWLKLNNSTSWKYDRWYSPEKKKWINNSKLKTNLLVCDFVTKTI